MEEAGNTCSTVEFVDCSDRPELYRSPATKAQALSAV